MGGELAEDVLGVAAGGAEVAPELPCCCEYWAKLASGNASIAPSSAKRNIGFMVSPWLRLLQEEQSTCRWARQMSDSLFPESPGRHEERACQPYPQAHFLRLTLPNAAFSPSASFCASSFAQKCMKKSRGSSSSMWLCSAVTSMPLSRKVLRTAFTSFAISTKSPVIAALPPPVG